MSFFLVNDPEDSLSPSVYQAKKETQKEHSGAYQFLEQDWITTGKNTSGKGEAVLVPQKVGRPLDPSNNNIEHLLRARIFAAPLQALSLFRRNYVELGITLPFIDEDTEAQWA